jgi:hypothetical protein
MIKKVLFLSCALALVLHGVSCKKGGASFSATGIQGKWALDVEAMNASAEMKTERKDAMEIINIMAPGFTYTITGDTIITKVNIPGEVNESNTEKYKVVSSDKQKVVLEILDGEEKGKKREIINKGQNSIMIGSNDSHGAVLYLKRK